MTKQQIIKYIKENELDIQSARALPFFCLMAFSAYSNSHKAHKNNFSPIFCYLTSANLEPFYQIIPKNNLESLNRAVYKKYLKNPASLNILMEKHKKLSGQMDKIWEEYQKKDNLIVAYENMVSAAIKWWHLGVIGEDKGEIINLEIVPKFAKKYKITLGEARDAVSYLAHPKEQTILNIERIEFFKICLLESKEAGDLNFKNDKKFRRAISGYIKNFFWIKSDFCQFKKITEDDLFADVRNELSEKGEIKIRGELKEINANFRKINKKKKNLLKKFNLSTAEKADIEFACRVILWIDYRKIWMMKHVCYLCHLIKKISEEYDIPYDNLIFYQTSEISQLLKTGKRVSHKVLSERNQGSFVIFEKNNNPKFFQGKTGKDLFELATAEESHELKGMVACSGKEKIVKGTIKIILHPEKENFNSGEILVTSMTRVEYLPLMRKAKAIITNEGGIACHAAIVSRELGIPCVIGTKSATKLLKNGDFVEINTQNGIIKILNT
ncbi:MAG: PEP-utilizing enzyme [bacterium]